MGLKSRFYFDRVQRTEREKVYIGCDGSRTMNITETTIGALSNTLSYDSKRTYLKSSDNEAENLSKSKILLWK
jgi:hypothetical protein